MPMTPKDMERVREQLGLTRAQLAEALGVSRRAVVYWEGGERPITRVVELAVGMLLQQHRQQPPRKRTAR
jgi:DNA-binding transcriptional regulator YiaG